MSFGKTFTMKRRIAKAAWTLVINLILWVVIPYYLGTLLAGKLGGTPLTIPTFVFEFGILFTILEVGAAFFDGMAISVPFLSGAAILSAVYLWLVTDGGNLSVAASGLTISLGFTTLVYVFVVPSIWAAIRAPLSYLIWRRAMRSSPLPPPPPPAP